MNMGILNACIFIFVLKVSVSSVFSNLLDTIKSDPDLSQVIVFKSVLTISNVSTNVHHNPYQLILADKLPNKT